MLQVGGNPASKVYIGGTQASAVYLGGTKVWPTALMVPTTPIIWVGSTVGSGTTNIFPTHVAGDLLVAAAISSTNTPRTPPSGYTTAYTSTTGFAALTVAYRWATAAGTQFGTWPSGTAYTAAYVFRGVNKDTPFGSINSAAVESVTSGTAPAITLNTASGDSLVGHLFFNNGTAGVWGTLPAGVLSKNAQARMANVQKIDTRTATADPVTMTHTTGPATFRTASFELLVPAPPAVPDYTYGVRIEYLDNYLVRFTALKGLVFPDDEFWFFRCTQMPKDGYTARTFEKQWQSNGYGTMDCTLEDQWGTGQAGQTNTRTILRFRMTPRAVGNGLVEEYIAPTPEFVNPAADPMVIDMPPIKAVKSSMLYHTPDSPYYNQTSSAIVFPTEEEAQAAGYTKYVRK